MAPFVDVADPGPLSFSQRGRRLDILGMLLVLANAAWALVTALDREQARPWPVVALAGGSLLLAMGARMVGSARVVPGVLAIAIAGSLVLGFPDLLAAGGAPTGYANANADLAALGAVAAAATGALAASRRERQAWVALSVGLSLAVGAIGSVAAMGALAVVAGLTVACLARMAVAPAVIGGLVVASLMLSSTVAVSHGSDLGGLRQRDELRAELWAAAADVAADHPLRGIGTGSYEALGVVSSDPDLRWAHHGYLQVAAEAGLVGLALLLALVGWVYARLWTGRRRASARTLTGAAAITLVAAHASVDHLLHRAAVPLTLAVLVGWATADRPDRGTQGSRLRQR